jgi:hypothetical protein
MAGPRAAPHDLCTTKCPVFTWIGDIAHPREFWARPEQPVSERCVVPIRRVPQQHRVSPYLSLHMCDMEEPVGECWRTGVNREYVSFGGTAVGLRAGRIPRVLWDQMSSEPTQL